MAEPGIHACKRRSTPAVPIHMYFYPCIQKHTDFPFHGSNWKCSPPCLSISANSKSHLPPGLYHNIPMPVSMPSLRIIRVSPQWRLKTAPQNTHGTLQAIQKSKKIPGGGITAHKNNVICLYFMPVFTVSRCPHSNNGMDGCIPPGGKTKTVFHPPANRIW